MNRKKLLALNTISSLVLQFTTLICGFILPRLILKHFGSEINGLVGSISYFLGIIGLLELGVGSVVQSALYKPLADKDDRKISEIIVSANIFFRNLALILSVYVVVLCCSFPFLRNNNFDWLFNAELILAISISMFAQYYFGIVNSLLLNSAQRGYIQYNAQTLTLIFNTIACAMLIRMDASIQLVRFTTSIIYLARPIYMAWYVNKNFNIDYNVTYLEDPIKQKWNGIAQHVASVALGVVPVTVLTIFATFSDVSVFTVYFLVVNGIKTLILSLTNGAHALMGEMWAKQELENLRSFFDWAEWAIHTFAVYAFGCTAILIVPFVKVYTDGINDIDYIKPCFALVLVFAHAAHCFRLPYNMMILAAGHYKETQNSYIIAAVSNCIVAVTCTIQFGLMGVAIGAAIALYYQAFWMANYVASNLIKWPIKFAIKQFAMDGLAIICAIILAYIYCDVDVKGYIDWFFLAIKVVMLWTIVIIVLNSMLYREKILFMVIKARRKFVD